MNFRQPYFTTYQTDERLSFYLSPPATSVLFPKPRSITHAGPDRDCLDFGDLPDVSKSIKGLPILPNIAPAVSSNDAARGRP